MFCDALMENFYVGKTRRCKEERFLEHLSGTGSAWTALNKPIEIIKWIKVSNENGDVVDSATEDSETIQMMSIHGIENVRGGAFVAVTLPQHQLKTLGDMINSNNDSCFVCGSDAHFASWHNNSCQDTTAIGESNKPPSTLSANVLISST